MTTQNPRPASRHPVKREREADEDSHDSSFADLAENTPKRGHKGSHGRSHHRDSNQKTMKRRTKDEEEDSEDEDEENDSDLSGFIAKDEEVEAELIEEYERKKKSRKRERKAERKQGPDALDEEDLEVIKENIGIEIERKKKNRLKRNADLEAEKHALVKDEKIEQDSEQIDTTSRALVKEQSSMSRVKDQRMEFEKREYGHARVGPNINSDQIRQAQEIFGDDKDGSHLAQRLAEARMSSNVAMEDVFQGDEIDDPFSSAADQKILKTDIPERLQVKLENRMKPSDEELTAEAEWVLDRLSFYCAYQKDDKTGIDDPFEKRSEPTKFKYGKLLQQKDAKTKIYKVLSLLRCEMRDVPMIAKHRKMVYADELDEDSIWIIYNLDQEYGRFLRHKKQIQDFLTKAIQINSQIKVIDEELLYAKTQSDLNNFNALIRFLRSYYHDELSKSEEDVLKKKAPPKRDEIQVYRKRQFDEFASNCFISWSQYLENLRLKKLAHVPPELKQHPSTLARQYSEPISEALADDPNEVHRREMDVFQGVCKLAAIELSVQPFIRSLMKKHVYATYELSTNPTDQGQKDLDLFHQSYRVKRIKNMDLRKLRVQSDLYLDVEQCEKANLIKVDIRIEQSKKEEFKDMLASFYMQKIEGNRDWNIMRSEVIRILYEDILSKEIVKEIRDEIKEEAENFVIARCKEAYRDMCYTGPFTTTDPNMRDEQRLVDAEMQGKRGKKHDGDVIKDRDRLNVMGCLMHQIDQNNYLVTVAIVNKYGDLVAHKDFKRLLPPKVRRPLPGPDGQPMIDARLLPKSDDELQHEKEKEVMIEFLEQQSVDLIVVAANSLRAIDLKRSLEDIAAELKNREAPIDDDDPKGKNYSQRKEAFVIWGSTEVPKLFSLSHNSQRILMKNTQQMLKQAISLARYEQDPLAEILNLWSPITAENQALALNLDPMQKLINQSKLADGLEEVNIQVVNDIGIDINLIVDHDHLHSLLPFVSGLGPRKAKDLISKIKSLGRKIWTRAEIFKQNLLGGQCCYVSAIPFIKVKIPEDDINAGFKLSLDLRDQTRIHIEYYDLAQKIACDACQVEGDNSETDLATKNRMLKDVFMNPAKLSRLDMKGYYKQLELSGRSNYKYVVEWMIKEFTEPFKDPRAYRSPTSINIKNERLLYLLIDESKRTFKPGIIVTATVNKVLDSKAICRLDNGLTAIIPATKILEQDSQEKLKDIIDIGHIVTGRIIQIKSDDEKSFEVTLNCKQAALSSHEEFKTLLAQSLNVNPDTIPVEDLLNQNFSTDLKPKQAGRFVMRRIAHEKFKNISSRRALAELNESEVGDYVFRPSTRSENSITLTWKFFKKHFVHIDITEQDKPQGAAIGKRLLISNDSFDNLREIIERYIIPCNRLVREVTSHTKFLDAETFEELEERVREEKKEQPQRIPYRFSILPQYPQHIVLAYVPREKVVKEFIKVRPKGFYFHDQSHTPFQNLINWFKDNWSTREYQRHAKRQKSPKTQVKAPTVTNARDDFQSGASRGDWKTGYDQPMKSEMKAEYQKTSYNVKEEASGWNQGGGAWGGQDAKMTDESKPWGQSAGWGGGDGGASPKQQSRGRGCFKCGEDGHISRDCPKAGGGGGSGGNACYKCGETGHFSRECPKAAERSGNRGCFKCGGEGHMARDCPNAQSNQGGERRGGGGGSRACYKCHKEGHMARDCPEAGGDNDRGAGGPYKRPRRDEDGFGGGGFDSGATKQENGWGAPSSNNDAGW